MCVLIFSASHIAQCSSAHKNAEFKIKLQLCYSEVWRRRKNHWTCIRCVNHTTLMCHKYFTLMDFDSSFNVGNLCAYRNVIPKSIEILRCKFFICFCQQTEWLLLQPETICEKCVCISSFLRLSISFSINKYKRKRFDDVLYHANKLDKSYHISHQ